MARIEFIVGGPPVRWHRPRARRLAAPAATPGFIELPPGFKFQKMRFWTDPREVAYRQKIAVAARAAAVGLKIRGEAVPLEGPLRMVLTFYLRRPRRLSRKGQDLSWVWAPCRPDASNLAKAVEDALNGVLYTDDAQIADTRIRKRYAAGPGHGDPRPRVEIALETLPRGGEHAVEAAEGVLAHE